MLRWYAFAWVLAATLFGCPTPAPVPPPQPPDASDAAPAPLRDSAPPQDALPPQSPCQAACSALAAAGCPQGTAPDCATTLAHVDGSRLVRTPSGAPLTCAALAGVKTPADARALGVSCP